MIASTYDNSLVPVAASGSYYQTQPEYQSQATTAQVLNHYTKEYLNNVRENRSKYGSFVDNALTYDPYKEQKSMYNVVHDTADYFPWGKPGGGAPKLNGDTGTVVTKLSGSLKWNLNGETSEDRKNRLLRTQRTNTNLLLYKKPTQQMTSPRAVEAQAKYALPPIARQATTYSYNMSDHFAVPSIPFENSSPSNSVMHMIQPAAPQFSQPLETSNASFSMQQSLPIMPIEREAHIRSYDRSFIDRPTAVNSMSNSSWVNNTTSSQNFKEKPNELTKLSKSLYAGNQPSQDSPNSTYWFGRAGPQVKYVDETGNPPKVAAHSYDVRRRKLIDSLENRPSSGVQNWSTYNAHHLYDHKVYEPQAQREATSLKPNQSSHRNKYENEMKMTG